MYWLQLQDAVDCGSVEVLKRKCEKYANKYISFWIINILRFIRLQGSKKGDEDAG